MIGSVGRTLLWSSVAAALLLFLEDRKEERARFLFLLSLMIEHNYLYCCQKYICLLNELVFTRKVLVFKSISEMKTEEERSRSKQ